MVGKCIYYDKLNNQIGVIDKLYLWIILNHHKVYHDIAIELSDERKSYNDLLKIKTNPFQKVSNNYYKWQVTNNDFLIISFDKSLEETIKDMKIENYEILSCPSIKGKLFKYLDKLDGRI